MPILKYPKNLENALKELNVLEEIKRDAQLAWTKFIEEGSTDSISSFELSLVITRYMDFSKAPVKSDLVVQNMELYAERLQELISRSLEITLEATTLYNETYRATHITKIEGVGINVVRLFKRLISEGAAEEDLIPIRNLEADIAGLGKLLRKFKQSAMFNSVDSFGSRNLTALYANSREKIMTHDIPFVTSLMDLFDLHEKYSFLHFKTRENAIYIPEINLMFSKKDLDKGIIQFWIPTQGKAKTILMRVPTDFAIIDCLKKLEEEEENGTGE